MSKFELFVQDLIDEGLDVETVDLGDANLEVGVETDIGASDMSVGEKGADGVGVESVTQIHVATKSGEPNIIRIKLTNGKTYDVEVRNGNDYILTDEDKKDIAKEVDAETITDDFIDELFV